MNPFYRPHFLAPSDRDIQLIASLVKEQNITPEKKAQIKLLDDLLRSGAITQENFQTFRTKIVS